MNPTAIRQTRTEAPTQARYHPLFPMLDMIAKSTQQMHQKIAKLEGSMHQMKEEVKVVQNALNELKQLSEKTVKSSFSLKEEGYEV